MKRIINYIAFMAAVLAAASCVEPLNNVNPVQGQGQDLKLSFSCGVMTKAQVVGTGNENLVNRIDYFVFAYGEDGKVADDAEYVYTNSITTTSANNKALSYEETIAHEYLDDIFPNGADKAVVFAVANYVDFYGANNDMTDDPNTTIPEDVKTWKGLHELEVGPTFFYDDQNPDFLLRWPHVLQPDAEDLFFVMAADSAVISLVATANEEAGGAVVNGVVPLERLASKVTVNFVYENVEETKANGDVITWVPQATAGETRVYLSNAIEHTTLGGPLQRDLVADSWGTATKPLGNGKRDIFEYAYNFMNSVPVIDGKKTAHFYTYPLQFDEGDDNQPYLKLVLPWYGYKGYVDEDNPGTLYKQKEVYYKIVLPRETINEPNRIYEYSVKVNILGNDKDVEVTGYQYVVKNWLTDKAINSNVAMGKYISLDIPKDQYDTYVNNTQILFVSSGKVVISKLQIYDMNMTGTAAVERYYINGGPTSYVNPYNANTPDAAGNTLPNWATVQGSQLVINHAMNTNINSNDVNISPFTFVVTLHLEDEGTNTRFDRKVTITQYPPIYVETRFTEDYSTTFLNKQQYTRGSRTNVFNNRGGTQYTSPGWIGQIGMTTGEEGETSKNKTVVTVTTLANLDLTRYTSTTVANPIVGVPVIGDPRVSISERPVDGWNTQDLGNAGNEYIQDYMYTDPDKQNVIAPKIMIASGYGSSAQYKPNWIQTVERCAAYQEDGYPAGRWRLPTEAEMLFISTLARERHLIPDPFYVGSRYFANTGRYYYQNAFHDDGGNRSSRCVYDLWYWGDHQYAGDENNPIQITEGSTLEPATAWLGFMTTK